MSGRPANLLSEYAMAVWDPSIKHPQGKAIITELVHRHKLQKNFPCQDPDLIKKINFADIRNDVEERINDYHFLFGNLVATDPVADPAEYEAAFARFLTIFSENLTEFTVKTNGAVLFPGNTKADVEFFYRLVTTTAFFGFTQHASLNNRVAPILNSTKCQAGLQSRLFQVTRFQIPDVLTNDMSKIMKEKGIFGTALWLAERKGAIPADASPVAQVPIFAQDIGDYNITWVFEDGLFRIKTWIFDDRETNSIIPDILSPTPYQPSADIPTSCHSLQAAQEESLTPPNTTGSNATAIVARRMLAKKP